MFVTFLHPDFGIGGAERLVLDAALALRKKGHEVRIVTNHFSADHCFLELNSFREDLTVVGGFPRQIFGKFNALCAYIRLCIAALYICIFQRDSNLIFCDQISAPLPILRVFTNASLLFYCHYPDQLLTFRDSFWKTTYRSVIDAIEAWTLQWANEILVNSNFTKRVVQDTFPSMVNRHLTVLHPSLNFEFFKTRVNLLQDHRKELENEFGDIYDLLEDEDTFQFLSINRFERKKNIELAIHAFANFLNKLDPAPVGDPYPNYMLIIVGGYDPLNSENIHYFKSLVDLVNSLGMEHRVKFVKSPSDNAKIWLLSIARLVVYTPDREHFGIVPLEAMFMNAPVLAVNSGGPTETVIDGETGFLRKPEPEEFARAMLEAASDMDKLEEMGDAGRLWVEKNFSFDAFADKLDQFVGGMCSNQQQDEELKGDIGEKDAGKNR